MKVGDQIIIAARKQAEGEIEVHKTNIMVYQTMPAGIGEHSDITEAVIEELNKLAEANDRLEMIDKYFHSEQNIIMHFTVYKTRKMIYNSYNQ